MHFQLFAEGVHYALGRTAIVLLGGGLQMLTYFLWNLLQRHGGHDEAPVLALLWQLQIRSRQLWRSARELLTGVRTR